MLVSEQNRLLADWIPLILYKNKNCSKYIFHIAFTSLEKYKLYIRYIPLGHSRKTALYLFTTSPMICVDSTLRATGLKGNYN